MNEPQNSMIRLWIGTALLAGSWLLGLGYFYPANPWAWLATVLAAIVLLSDTDSVAISLGERRSWRLDAASLALLLPAVWFAPWPDRAAPLLLVLGLTLQLLPIRQRWSDRLTCGAMAAGVVMLVQALALEVYSSHTAWSHELPWPLPDLLGGIAGLLGIDAAVDGSSVVMHSMRQVHRLRATWELLLDPTTFLFLVGGLTALGLRRNGECGTSNEECVETAGESADSRHLSSFVLRHSDRWSARLRSARWFTLIVLAWLPCRAGLLMALYLHRVLRSDPNRPLHAMNHFFSPWLLLLLLSVPVLLAWRFVRAGNGKRAAENADQTADEQATEAPPPPHSSFLIPHSTFRPLFLASLLVALAIALFTAAIYWDPVGARREGRVTVVERHSEWSPTTKPYDTTWFAEPPLFGEASGYNYAAIYDYLGQFYQMSRLLESDKIDAQTLARCDVLVIKIPTTRYSQAEAQAVTRFVEQGGGLLLIGDHTNYMGSATAMNDITRPMGFTFHDDILYSFNESPDDESYARPLIPHPSVQDVPAFDWAGTCSIEAGHSHGRAVITGTGVFGMGPDYHFGNYMPFAQHGPEMRYGAFVKVWAARHGQGRAIAFPDSTLFSNFCTFQPGKAELMLGMVEWLNHGNPPLDPRPWLLLLGILPLAGGLWIARGHDGVWLVLLAAATCGWVAASLAVTAAHRWAMPTPQRLRPQCRVVIDRNVSTVPLANGLFTRRDGEGYGMFESWIARLGCYTVREKGPETFSGDAIVVLCPTRSVPEEFRARLRQYVEQGGKLLVIDSPENTDSTANSLLWQFRLSIRHDRAWKGKLSTGAQLPAVDVAGANEVHGGEPAAKLDKWPVAATVKFGKGTVMAVGFGSLWNDKSMGEHAPKENLDTAWMIEPDATVRARYDVLFALLKSFLEGKPLPTVPPPAREKGPAEMGPAETGPKENAPPQLKESGPAEL